ncbi:hypothetical protein GBAR_LOCUS23658, partial [Geodia barretti]
MVQTVAQAHHVGDHPAHETAGQDAPVDFGQPEERVLGGNGEVTGHQRSEGAAEAKAVHHGDGGLGEGEELPPAPLLAAPARLPAKRLILVALAEILLEILTGAPATTGAGNDHDLGFRVPLAFRHRVIHVEVELRTHGVRFSGRLRMTQVMPSSFSTNTVL